MRNSVIYSEFQKQRTTLLQKRYPQIARVTADAFVNLLKPLEKKLESITCTDVDLDVGRLPFVIVIKSELVPTEKAMAAVDREGKRGIVKLFPHEPEDFLIVENAVIPITAAYLLIDIDRGKKSINIPPSEAMGMITREHRSPLTIDEGVAIMTQFPDFLMKNNCFSLLASRNPNDKRVPAIWINAQKQPNLGWCWEGNPHTWLGSASCRKRI